MRQRSGAICLGRFFTVVLVLLHFAPRADAQDKAPDAVEAIAFSPTMIRVYWNPVVGAVGYTVYRVAEGQAEQPIGTAGANERMYEDTTAQPNTTYRYSVAARDGRGTETRGVPYVERSFAPLQEVTDCDVLVVGATTAGVAASVTASRYGLNVVLIADTRRLGGMTVNGLSASDLRRVEHSSGFFEEFRQGIVAMYGGKGTGLQYEPRIAHQVMKSLLWNASGLTVYRQMRPVAVKVRNSHLTEITAEEVKDDGSGGRRVRFRPRLVIDATECGDVAAWAGVPYRVGREARSRREPHAGVIYYSRKEDRLLPGSTGAASPRIQAYAYLMTVKKYPAGEDHTIPKPEGYDPAKYDGAPAWAQSWATSSGKLPNDKFEINQHPEGSDLQGVNYDYPTANYAERRRIESLYKNHALGYLYYIQTVQGQKNIGLSEDDFRDSGNWPTLLYIREARRFDAEARFDESDILNARDVARSNAIGLGDYAMDSHATQPRKPTDGEAMGEGEFYLPQYTPWHQIPYSIMVPKRIDNLYLPTAISATHVAYGTYRMEPVRMHFGTAAGIGAYFCLKTGLSPQQIPARQIQGELLKQRGVTAGERASEGIGSPGAVGRPTLLYLFSDVPPTHPRFEAIQWLGARGFLPAPKPKVRTPSGGLTGGAFRPEEPQEIADALRLTEWLLAREKAAGERPNRAAMSVLSSASGGVLTRGLAAQWLAVFAGWRPTGTTAHYSDLTPGTPVQQAAEALYERLIRSSLWEGDRAYDAQGRPRFAPDKPLTRAEFAELLLLAHRHFGPLWYDQPADLSPIPVQPPAL